MAVGVLTFHWAINHGAVLQAYALRAFMRSLGYEVRVINFAPSELVSLYSINPLSHGLAPKRIIERLVYLLVGGCARTVRFRSFSRCFLGLTRSVSTLESIAGEFDAIVVGSDQVWNPDIVGKYLSDYLLVGVTDKIKRISYAASFGISDLPDSCLELFEKGLKSFDFISVREANAKRVLKERLGIESEVTLDPVFLLDEGQWLSSPFLPCRDKSKKSHVLLYMLGFDSDLIAVAKQVAKRLRLPLYCIQVPYFSLKRYKAPDRNVYGVGPLEFPQYFKNAECVITDSFHGTAFSIIFRTPFLVKAPPKVGGRIENILHITRTEGHLLPVSTNDSHLCIDRLIERAHVFSGESEKALKEHIAHSVRFLKRALGDD